MKYLLLILALASAAWGATITAANATRDSVQAAINRSSDGDTVAIPTGTAKWNANGSAPAITISGKNIYLKGNGIANTVITCDSSAYPTIKFTAIAGSTRMRISGMRLKYGRHVSTEGTINANGNNWRVDNIQFDSVSVSGCRQIGAYGTGVIDHCRFNEAGYQGISVFGQNGSSDVFDGDSLWNVPDTLGTAKAVYVEDCYFYYHSSEMDGAIDAYAGRFVCRYDTIIGTSVGLHGFDTGPRRSAHGYEIYHNKFINRREGNLYAAMNIRGGTGVIYNNADSGAVGVTILLQNYRTHQSSACSYPDVGKCDGTCAFDSNQTGKSGYPCRDQIGRGPTQKLIPLYAWNNTHNGDARNAEVYDGSSPSDTLHVKLNRDYYNSKWPDSTAYTYPHPLAGGSACVGVSILTNPANKSADTGTTANFTVSVNGDAPAYQWQVSTDGGSNYANTANGTGGTTSSYTTIAATTAMNQYRYRVIVSNSCPSVDTSTGAILTVTTLGPRIQRYVSTTGSDVTGDGTSGNPWASFTYGVAHMNGGDTLNVAAGIYNGSSLGIVIRRTINGTSQFPTLIRCPSGIATWRHASYANWRITIDSSAYITFRNIESRYSQNGFMISGRSHDIKLISCISDSTGGEAFHIKENSYDILIDSCTMKNTEFNALTNGEGIYCGSAKSAFPDPDTTRNVTISNCLIFNAGCEGVELKPGTRDCIITNNIFHDCNLQQIFSSTTNTGDSVTYTVGTLEIDNCDDGGGRYSYNPMHVLKNNIIYGGKNCGINLNTGSTAYNNIIYTCKYLGIVVKNDASDAFTRYIYHNTVDAANGYGIVVQAGTAQIRNNIGSVVSYNVNFGSYFINAATHDYRLYSGASTVVNTGLDLRAVVPLDIVNYTRDAQPDLGAYELVTPPHNKACVIMIVR